MCTGLMAVFFGIQKHLGASKKYGKLHLEMLGITLVLVFMFEGIFEWFNADEHPFISADIKD